MNREAKIQRNSAPGDFAPRATETSAERIAEKRLRLFL
jgi:hypothetical protein